MTISLAVNEKRRYVVLVLLSVKNITNDAEILKIDASKGYGLWLEQRTLFSLSFSIYILQKVDVLGHCFFQVI